jgi:hypothetical protein
MDGNARKMIEVASRAGPIELLRRAEPGSWASSAAGWESASMAPATGRTQTVHRLNRILTYDRLTAFNLALALFIVAFVYFVVLS